VSNRGPMTGPFTLESIIGDLNLLLPGEIPPEKIEQLHTASLNEIKRLASSDTIILVLGNYSKPQISRVKQVRDELSRSDFRVAYILKEVDPDMTAWENFYIKFRVLLKRSDCIVAVVEDNDGGHELELGEVDLDQLHVLKRDYSGPSIDSDIEYERYDAMISTMFDLLDQRGRLHEWTTEPELEDQIDKLESEL